MNRHSIKQLHSFLLLWGSQTVSQLGTAMTDYAIIIWVYSQKGTASRVTLLTVCSFLPTIFLRFLAGSMVDRWSKKRIMLIADLLAACGTLAVFVLHSADVLQIWHLYVINFLLSLMNAFQEPASFVAVSMLVPKEHYARASGLQGFGGAAISILAPALGALLLAYGGLELVLIVDLATFAIAFLVLLFLIRIPEMEKQETKEEPFSGGRVKTVMMMNDKDNDRRLSYAQRSDYSLLRIPYRGGYVMYVILPKSGRSLSSVIQKLSIKEFQNAIDNLSHYDIIHIKLPKFEVNYDCIANKWLTSMGIRKVFGRDADFGNLNKDFYLDRISQYAKVKVDEIGTDASALTSEVLKVKGEDAEEEKTVVYFYADHPFAYIIRDTFGNYCFMGTFWGNE